MIPVTLLLGVYLYPNNVGKSMFDVGHYFTRDHRRACSPREDELIQVDLPKMLLNLYLPLAGKVQFFHLFSVSVLCSVGRPAKITDAYYDGPVP